jgi:hypothetical protein
MPFLLRHPQNSRTMTDKLVKNKCHPVAKKHVEFRESKTTKLESRSTERGACPPHV